MPAKKIETEPRQIVFAEYKQKKNDELGVSVTLADDTVMFIPAPILWPTPDDDEKNDDFAARIVGSAEVWEKFKAEGGDFFVLDDIIKQQFGTGAGE